MYHIPFHHLPPMTREPWEFQSYDSGSKKIYELQEVDMIVEIIQDRVPAFYSKLCLIANASALWRRDISVATQHLCGFLQI